MPERILETADRLFYGQGLRAVGVDTIAAEIGISKRTLYNHFPSKDALMVAYLQRRLRLVPTSTKPPGRQILDDFARLARNGHRNSHDRSAVAQSQLHRANSTERSDGRQRLRSHQCAERGPRRSNT